MDKCILYVIDKDVCPNQENVIMQKQCGGCQYYQGFEKYNGQPCVKCSFYSKSQEDREE